MEHFAKFMKDVSRKFADRVTHLIQHGEDIAKNPNSTRFDYALWEQEWKDLFKDLGSDAQDATEGEVKEHVVKDLRSQGMSKSAAEAWFESRAKDVKDLAEKMRGLPTSKSAHSAGNAAKFVWAKGIALATAAVAVITVTIHTGTQQGQGVKASIHRVDTEYSELLAQKADAYRQLHDGVSHDDYVRLVKIIQPAQPAAVAAVAQVAPTPETSNKSGARRCPLCGDARGKWVNAAWASNPIWIPCPACSGGNW